MLKFLTMAVLTQGMFIDNLLNYLSNHKVITFVVIAILFDTIAGILVAIKQRKTNSTIGIDGMIRKIAMIIGLAVLIVVDFLLNLNFVGWLPKELLSVFSTVGMDYVGISDLFGLLFIAFELLSIIKNWTLLGLPMFKGVTDWVSNFLELFTDELPTTNKNQ